jgi:cardiolipin synthase (CMP-forming)
MPTKWLPNLLTGIRLALVPVLIHALSRVPADAPLGVVSGERAWALLVLLVMGATDLADGWAARRFDAATRLGSVADVTADRLTVLAPLFYVATVLPAGFPWVPFWAPLWLVLLDLLVGVAWYAARIRRRTAVSLEHSNPGRFAAVLLFALVVWVIAGLPSGPVPFVALAALVTASLSAALHVRAWWTH